MKFYVLVFLASLSVFQAIVVVLKIREGLCFLILLDCKVKKTQGYFFRECKNILTHDQGRTISIKKL